MKLTKNQLKVQGLRSHVQPLSEYKKEQAKKKCFPKPKMWVRGYRNRINIGNEYESGRWCKCEYCGHEWTTKSNQTDFSCPSCGSKLEPKTTMKKSLHDKAYFNVVTTCGEYQVVTL